MNWSQICRDKWKICLEVGLAVLLMAATGIVGERLSADKKAEQAAVNLKRAEEENHAARDVLSGATESEQKPAEEKTPAEEDTSDGGETIKDGQYPIMGSSDVTAEKLAAYYASGGFSYPEEELAKGGADSIEAFCQIYCEEAEAEGVRPEVAFAQSMKETGWLQYGGDASIEQFNFAGLGTTGGGVPGNSYPDVRTGIRAQIQHLKAYATAESLSGQCVDDRYEYVVKGSAPYVEWLGQKENPQGQGWAVAENYGYSIVSMIHQIEQIE